MRSFRRFSEPTKSFHCACLGSITKSFRHVIDDTNYFEYHSRLYRKICHLTTQDVRSWLHKCFHSRHIRKDFDWCLLWSCNKLPDQPGNDWILEVWSWMLLFIEITTIIRKLMLRIKNATSVHFRLAWNLILLSSKLPETETWKPIFEVNLAIAKRNSSRFFIFRYLHLIHPTMKLLRL